MFSVHDRFARLSESRLSGQFMKGCGGQFMKGCVEWKEHRQSDDAIYLLSLF